MFSGGVPLDDLKQEKPGWVTRLRQEGRLANMAVAAPALWFRTVYLLFAYAMIAFGLYLVLAALPYARSFHP